MHSIAIARVDWDDGVQGWALTCAPCKIGPVHWFNKQVLLEIAAAHNTSKHSEVNV